MSTTFDPAKLKVVELRSELTARGLDAKGNKPALVKRLKDALELELKQDLPDTSIADTSTEDLDTSQDEIDPVPTETIDLDDDTPDNKASEVEESILLKDDDSPAAQEEAPEKNPMEEEAKNPVEEEAKNPVEEEAKKPVEEEAELMEEDETDPTEEPSETAMDTTEAADEAEPETTKPPEASDDVEQTPNDIEPVKSEEDIEKPSDNGEPEPKEDQNEHKEDQKQERKPEKRKRSSATPERSQRKRSRSPVKEDEPEIDPTKVLLSWFDSDLHLQLNKESFLSGKPLNEGIFGYAWAGVRATHGFSKGKVCYEVKITEELKWEDVAKSCTRDKRDSENGDSKRTDRNKRKKSESDHRGDKNENDTKTEKSEEENKEKKSEENNDEAKKENEDSAETVSNSEEKPENNEEKEDEEKDNEVVEAEDKKEENENSEAKNETSEEKNENSEEKNESLEKKTENSEDKIESSEKKDESSEEKNETTEEKNEENMEEKMEVIDIAESTSKEETGDDEKSEEQAPPSEPIIPHLIRVGWSLQNSDLQLGEHPNSFAYESSGRFLINNKFNDYAVKCTQGDVIGAYLCIDEENIVVTYTINGVVQPNAAVLPKSDFPSENCVLFPHVLSKNYAFELNLGNQETPWFPTPLDLEDYVFLEQFEDKIAGPVRPTTRSECEVILLCGLPASGKTYWANNFIQENSEKLFTPIGNTYLLNKMTISGTPLKEHFQGRWSMFLDKMEKSLHKIVDVASLRRRNYILDQVNIFPSTQRRKMRQFEGFKRKAVVIVLSEEEQEKRLAEQEKEEKKSVPEGSLLDFKAHMTIPEKGDWLDEIVFVGLPEEEAKEAVKKYNTQGKEAGYGPGSQRRFPRRDDKFSNRRNDHRGKNYRDNRSYQNNRYDNRGYNRPGGNWQNSQNWMRNRRDHRGPSGGSWGGGGGGGRDWTNRRDDRVSDRSHRDNQSRSHSSNYNRNRSSSSRNWSNNGSYGSGSGQAWSGGSGGGGYGQYGSGSNSQYWNQGNQNQWKYGGGGGQGYGNYGGSWNYYNQQYPQNWNSSQKRYTE